jgi:hypothetical protein
MARGIKAAGTGSVCLRRYPGAKAPGPGKFINPVSNSKLGKGQKTGFFFPGFFKNIAFQAYLGAFFKALHKSDKPLKTPHIVQFIAAF